MVREDLHFIGMKDFYKKSIYIQKEYKKLTLEEKWTYKYYVYSRPLLKDDWFKDVIWQYLNEERIKCGEKNEFWISQIDLYNESRRSRI